MNVGSLTMPIVGIVSINLAGSVLLAQTAGGQAVPDAGSLLRETERKPLRIPPTLVPRLVSPTEIVKAPDEVLFRVTRFDIEGIELVDESQVRAVLNRYLDRDIGFSDLERAMAEVAAVYERAGWLARVVVPEQDIIEGIVKLQVREARLGRIVIDEASESRLELDRVQRTLTARLGRGDPLNLRVMERSLAVLAETPGVSVSAALASGEAERETDIVVTLKDRKVLAGSLLADNGGSRSTGADRGIANVSLDNPLGQGEQLGLTLLASAGTRYALMTSSLPVGYDGWRIVSSASVLEYELVGGLAIVDAKGRAAAAGLRAQYPLLRRSSTNINTALSLDARTFDNDANGVSISQKSTMTFTASISGDSTDDFAGGGYLLWNTALSIGRLDLSDNVADQAADRQGPRTEGGFLKFAATLSRLQRITPATSLWLSVSGQSSSKNLDSSEKFALGGISFVRGFPTSEGVGDAGWLATTELRHTVNAKWQFSAFVDHGRVQLNHNDDHVFFDFVPNTYSLSSAGVGASYRPTAEIGIVLTAARRLERNPGAFPFTGKDADGTLDKTRIWLSSSWFF